jgi:UDP-2,3-diacylglucosamine hydrolase
MASSLPPVHDLAPMAGPVTVVGDVHLSPREPEVERRFLAWLARRGREGGTLVLLGDIFDAWVGPGQEREPRLAPLLEALTNLERRGVRLCFQGGNRDFLLERLPGVNVELWPDVVRTQWGTRRVLLTHGDLLVSGDRAYLRLRRLLRSRPALAVARRLPYRVRVGLARALRRASRRALRTKPRALVDIDYGLARRWMEAAEADVLVAGHVHTGVHHRLPGARPRDVLVLKDWDRHGGVVRFDGTTVALVGEGAA